VTKRRILGLAIATTYLCSVVLSGQADASNATKWLYPLRHGIRLTRVRYPGRPNEIRIVSVRPSKGSRIDLAPAGSHFPMAAKTSTMAAATRGAVLATNGDFGIHGAPKHPTMIDGELWTSGIYRGTAFGISDDGQSAFAGVPALRMKMTKLNGLTVGSLAGWNVGAPKGGAINGYTARGGSVYPVPGDSQPSSSDPVYCEARLVPTVGHDYTWSGSDRAWITRRYTVDEQPEPCTGAQLPLGSARGAVVLAANESLRGAKKITRLSPGRTVRLWWSFDGWPGVTDVVGAGQQIVDNGTNVAPADYSGAPHILDVNPRTAVGVAAGCSDLDPQTQCHVYLMTVDGRQADVDWSLGMKLPQLARRMLRVGAWDAVNLDGGGSTTLWARDTAKVPCESYPTVGGCLVNRPSESGERGSVTDAIAVLNKADRGTPAGLR
jgi:Phosphodiester glycosidase